jgi:hypothetical protein
METKHGPRIRPDHIRDEKGHRKGRNSIRQQVRSELADELGEGGFFTML